VILWGGDERWVCCEQIEAYLQQLGVFDMYGVRRLDEHLPGCLVLDFIRRYPQNSIISCFVISYDKVVSLRAISSAHDGSYVLGGASEHEHDR